MTYDRTALREQCMQFIESNTSQVLKSSGMAELSAPTLAYILQSNHLRASEEELLEAVEKWGAVNSAVGQQSLASVLKPVIGHIRFPLLKTETLKRIEQDNAKTEVVPVSLWRKGGKGYGRPLMSSLTPSRSHCWPRPGSTTPRGNRWPTIPTTRCAAAHGPTRPPLSRASKIWAVDGRTQAARVPCS